MEFPPCLRKILLYNMLCYRKAAFRRFPYDTMKKDFLFSTLFLAVIYSFSTLLYYSQIFLLYNYYTHSLITEMVSGWAYIAQAIGIVCYMLLYRYKKELFGKRFFLIALCLSQIPIIALSVYSPNGCTLLVMTVLLNIVIGIQTAFAFSLIACRVERRHFALSFAVAYSIGGIMTFLISRINSDILVSYPIILFACILAAIICGLFLMHADLSTSQNEPVSVKQNTSSVVYLCITIALMAVIIALGSNDPVLVEAGNQMNFLLTRIFYAVGLITAALIYDKNPTLGGICALASILYPLLVIMLYREVPIHFFLVGLTDTFMGFYAVYRAGSFLNIASATGRLSLAAFGLCISRIAEGTAIILINLLGFDRLTSFVTAGIVFVPLIILFCYALTIEKKETSVETESLSAAGHTAGPSFDEIYHLTRRESEIVHYLSENKTNGEIADLLCISESTVRFHVSNILKKTDSKNRMDVRHKYLNS